MLRRSENARTLIDVSISVKLMEGNNYELTALDLKIDNLLKGYSIGSSQVFWQM